MLALKLLPFLWVFSNLFTFTRAEDKAEDDVFVASAANFPELIKKNPRVLIEFYAPWCGHCKALEPEYAAAAAELKKRKRKTVLAKCDATVDSALASEHKVEGYPTLVYYVDGAKQEYNGPRKTDGIVKWLEERERDPVEVCKDQAEVDEKVKAAETPFVVVGKVVKKSGKAVAVKKAMQKLVAESKAELVYACYIYLAKGTDENKEGALTFYRTGVFDEADKKVEFTGKYNANQVGQWMLESFTSTVSPYHQSLYTDLTPVSAKYSVVLAAHSGTVIDAELKKKYVEKMRKFNAMNQYHREFRFAIWEGDKEDGRAQILASVPKDKSPVIVIMTASADVTLRKYILQESSPDKLEEFVNDFIKGSVKPTWKTAPTPKEEDLYEDEVMVLVGETFSKVALDPKKDVFVEFYAPWCGHCKKLAPEWTSLAKEVKKVLKSAGKKEDSVIIAKMDATENECDVEVKGFPKLVLFPANKNSMGSKKEFSGGERTMKPLLDFVMDAAVNMDGVEAAEDGGKIDKTSFSMVGRDRAKKGKKKAEL